MIPEQQHGITEEEKDLIFQLKKTLKNWKAYIRRWNKQEEKIFYLNHIQCETPKIYREKMKQSVKMENQKEKLTS